MITFKKIKKYKKKEKKFNRHSHPLVVFLNHNHQYHNGLQFRSLIQLSGPVSQTIVKNISSLYESYSYSAKVVYFTVSAKSVIDVPNGTLYDSIACCQANVLVNKVL